MFGDYFEVERQAEAWQQARRGQRDPVAEVVGDVAAFMTGRAVAGWLKKRLEVKGEGYSPGSPGCSARASNDRR
jgi:hypothetical protein